MLIRAIVDPTKFGRKGAQRWIDATRKYKGFWSQNFVATSRLSCPFGQQCKFQQGYVRFFDWARHNSCQGGRG